MTYNTFTLVSPTIAYKSAAIAYIKEFYEYHSPINGVGGLNSYLDDYEGWLKKLEEDRNRITTDESVPAETYFLIRTEDHQIIGMMNIRLELNEKLRNTNGHIGYSIRPTQRQNGYNKIHLYLGLLECQKRNIFHVMLTCNKENLGSARTILALGGKLEKEYYSKEHHTVVQVYWIDVNTAVSTKKEILNSI